MQLPIIGFNNTGYTEPFIAPVPITVGTAIAQDYSGFGITPSIALEYTEWGKNDTNQGVTSAVNQGLWCVLDTAVAGATFVTTAHNSLRPGMIVDNGGVFLEVVSVRTLPMIAPGQPQQEVEFSAGVTAAAGDFLYAVGKKLLIDGALATKNYAAGELVIEQYTVPVYTN